MLDLFIGLRYCYRLYKQITNIYKVKKHLDIIFSSYNEPEIIQKEKCETLKQVIFSNGSLYIKFFQWYISKLKSNSININNKKIYKDANANANAFVDGYEDICKESEEIEIKKSNNLINFIKYFEDIFEHCPEHGIEHTKNIFVNSMNGIMLESYVDIDTFKSIASGSIGQIYYAKRKEDNLEIAIKVKHPNIKEDLDNQYEIISFIKLLQYIKFLRNYFNLYINLDDFLTDINLQCDFNNEANNCKKFQENFKDSSNYIVFPKIIYQSDDLLISEYISGDSFENLSHIEKYQTSINFICFFYQMLLVDNFLHGDLHCKNWKVRKHKDTNTNTNNIQIIVYDCGICFQNTTLELTKDFWFSLINYDIISLSKVMINFVISNNDNNSIVNYVQIEKDMNSLFNTVLTESISTTILIKTIINFFRSNNIIVHKFLLNISILLCVIEEFLKENNIIDKDKNRNLKRISMFEIITDSELDIIAFCDVKKCYPKIRSLFSLDMNNKYANYRSNLVKNNITEIKNNENKLFSTLALSTLKFRPPE
jgi:predicted unusual protein kinase regulating ubiquinone biosynthesis (AarF/ABC1/UbiB family)